MTNTELSLFRTQINDDIDLLMSRWSFTDQNLSKPEYAFNYWVLSRIYSIDGNVNDIVNWETIKEWAKQ